MGDSESNNNNDNSDIPFDSPTEEEIVGEETTEEMSQTTAPEEEKKESPAPASLLTMDAASSTATSIVQQQQSPEQPPVQQSLTPREQYLQNHADRVRMYRIGDVLESAATIQSKWQMFLDNFRLPVEVDKKGMPTKLDVADPYYHKLVKDMRRDGAQTLTIDFNHVRHYTEHNNVPPPLNAQMRALRDIVLVNYDEAKLTAEKAVLDVMKRLVPDYVDIVKKRMTVGFKNIPITIEIPDINDEYLGKPIHIQGLVTTVDEPLLYLPKPVYKCHKGHSSEVKSKGTEHKPVTRCFLEECESPNVQLDEQASIRDSFQLIRIQQRLDRTLPGELPKVIDCVIFGRDRMNIVKPGAYADVSGLVKARFKDKKGFNSLAVFYIEVTGIESKTDDFMYDDPILAENVKGAVRKDTEKADYKRLIRSIAPSIKTAPDDIAKEACLLLLAGSDSRKLDGGTRHRGEGQIIFIGDPATGKTVTGKATMKLFARGILGNGKTITPAGLTLGSTTDKTTGAMRLDIGTYPLASSDLGGCVFLDEIDKTTKEVRDTLAALMDDEQEISKNTTNFHLSLEVKCGSIHSANPVLKENDGKYDRTKTILENTGIPKWLLSRYDLILIYVDVSDEKLDEAKYNHYMTYYDKSVSERDYDAVSEGKTEMQNAGDMVTAEGQNLGEDSSYWPAKFMRYWAKYVRQNYHPRLRKGSMAEKMIGRFYMNQRKAAGLTGSTITMRQTGSLIRFAEMSARAHHRNDVLPEDAEIAINIIKMGMASSGFNPITGQLQDPARTQQTPSSKKEELARFIRGVEDLTVKKCQACDGRGVVLISRDPVYGENTQPCNQCQDGYLYSPTFTEQQLIRHLASKMPAGTVQAYLRLCNEMRMPVLMMSNGPSGVMYTKVPGSWESYKMQNMPHIG